MPDPPETVNGTVLTLPSAQPPKRYHVRSFCVGRVPGNPARLTWGCEDCGGHAEALDHYDLGQQLAQHLDECTG